MHERRSFDVVIVGGGHNALVAATLLGRAGRSVLVLERRDEPGGAAVSAELFPGFGARLSRYSYLVSLFPASLARTLGVHVELRKRRIGAYPPIEPDQAWQSLLARIAERVFPTLTEPLRSREDMRRLLGDEHAWDAVFETPLSGLLERTFDSDLVRGTVLTDGLIGTFASAHDAGAAPEPLLPLPRGRRELGRAGRRHGSAVRRADRRGARGRCRARHPGARWSGSPPTARAPRSRAPTGGPTRRGQVLRRRRPGRVRAGCSAIPRPAAGPRAPSSRSTCCWRLPACASGRRPRGRLRRHVPRQRGLRAARGGVPAGRRRASARPRAVRGLLPLAERPEHPVRRAARRRRPTLTLFGLHMPARLFADPRRQERRWPRPCAR